MINTNLKDKSTVLVQFVMLTYNLALKRVKVMDLFVKIQVLLSKCCVQGRLNCIQIINKQEQHFSPAVWAVGTSALSLTSLNPTSRARLCSTDGQSSISPFIFTSNTFTLNTMLLNPCMTPSSRTSCGISTIPDESSEPGEWRTMPWNLKPNTEFSKNAIHPAAGALMAKEQLTSTLFVPVKCVVLAL